jgi:putative Mn2+ efflux pump MntP
MSILGALATAAALSADAFAVAVSKGLSAVNPKARNALVTGTYFGVFQALMTLLGFMLGKGFQGIAGKYAPLVAFLMLSVIGANMIRESRSQGEHVSASFGPATMLPLALATSIDAFAAGTSLALLGQANITVNVVTIGSVTFLLSSIGVAMGRLLGTKLKSGAEIVGGIILILMAIKALAEFFGYIHI